MEQKQLNAILMLLCGDLLNMLIKRKGLTYKVAAKTLYESKLYAVLEDEESKLWHFSVETLYSLLEEELTTGKIHFPEEQ